MRGSAGAPRDRASRSDQAPAQNDARAGRELAAVVARRSAAARAASTR